MARAFTSADIVQVDSGTTVSSADAGIGLPAGSTEGTCGIAVVGVIVNLGPPERWHFAAASGITAAAQQFGIFCRADLPAGESSWAFGTANGSLATWLWLAEEWTNVSFAPVAGTSGILTAPLGATSFTAGPTGSFEGSPYVVGIAAVFIQSSALSDATWPSVSWSDSFVETDVISLGDGLGTNDLQLRVARRYATTVDAGPWTTTATYTGSMAGKRSFGGLAAFRAENYDTDI